MRRLLAALGGTAVILTSLVQAKAHLAGTNPAAVVTGTDTGTGTAEPGSTSAIGQAVYTPFGPVQVRVVMSGGKITAVEATALPDRDRHSRRLSNHAEPILHDQALRAQSAEVGNVSGATFTSEAYARSLDTALDALR